MLKLTQPHLTMNNIFPPINGHSRPPSEDLRALGSTDIQSSTQKNSQPFRRSSQQNSMEQQQQRRTPLRSSSLLPTTGTRYVTAAAAAAAAVASSSATGSPLLRSPSFVQTAGASTQFEPAKIIYRSNDFAWSDHPNGSNAGPTSSLRAPSPLKNKLSTSARHLVNETIHENTVAATNGSTTNVQSPLGNSPNGFTSTLRDDMNNVDFLMTTNGKTRPTGRIHRTSSNIDKSSGTTGHALPMRSESYRSSRLDYGLRSRHPSSKQRHYISSKTSFYDINAGEFYVNGGAQDENLYYHQQSPINMINSSQRLNGSSFELNTSRKPFAASRSNTFNMPQNAHVYHSSSQDLHRHESNLERNHSTTRVAGRALLSKEQIGSTSKYRYTSSAMPASHSTTPAERHSDAHSYKSRDPNDSYAYNNVKKYIEENELMTPEKEQIIRNWILDVEKYRHQLQKFD